MLGQDVLAKPLTTGVYVRPDVLHAYVRDLLERLTGDRPSPDHDGDLPVAMEGAKFYVRVVGTVDPWLQVFSVALDEIEASSELMVQINEVNRQLRFARAFHVSRQVLIETEIWADDVNPANFAHACRNVASATDAFAPELCAEFGGRLFFDESKSSEYESQSAPRGNVAGPYL